MSTLSTTKTWPIGTLQRSLADKAHAEADGTAVHARDLGARTNPHHLSGRPYVVVTPELRWVMDWTPRSPEEARVHRALDRAEPDMIAEQANAGDAQADFVDQLIRAGHVERVPTAHAQAVLSHDDREAWIDGDDADDWDTDDGPANDPEALEAEYAAEDALHQAVAAARRAGVTAPCPGYTACVHNPFTNRPTWFASDAEALAYARAASAADVLDGDLGVWSVSGAAEGEYWMLKGGDWHAEG